MGADAVMPTATRKGPTFKAVERKSSLFAEKAVDEFLRWMTAAQDPDEVLLKAGITRAKLRCVTGDDEITAAMDTRREALLAIPWRLEPPGSDGERDTFPEPVQWLWDQFEPHAEKVLRSCLEALPYGYSVQEAIYLPAEGNRFTWGEITEKPFEWFIPKLDGTVLFRSMREPRGEPTDPRKFFLTARHQTYRQPYGEALFSRLYWPWFFRTNGWRFWVKWLERFGTPLLIGKTRGSAETMATELAKAVQDAAIAVGNDDEVQIAEQSAGSGHFESFERAVCGRIQRIILGQTLTSDAGGSDGKSGSYALGQVHNEVRKDRRDADVRMVRVTVQRMLDVLWDLNSFPGKAPLFVLQDDSGLEMERAERDAKLVTSGALRLTSDYFIRTYDFEPEDIIIPDPTATGDEPGTPGGESVDDDASLMADDGSPGLEATSEQFIAACEKAGLGTPIFDEDERVIGWAPFKAKTTGSRFTRKQQIIEDRLTQILRGVPQPTPSVLVADAIKGAENEQDLVNRLSVLLADAEPDEFRTTLERALFAADVLGFAHAVPANAPPSKEN